MPEIPSLQNDSEKTKLKDQGRFKSEEEILQVRDRIRKDNNEKANKKAEKLFLQYLSTQIDIDQMDYWLYEPATWIIFYPSFGSK